MNARITLVTAAIFMALGAWPLSAQDVRYYQENGQTYKATTQVTHQPVLQTRLEPREVTQFRPKYTTDLQEVQRTYQVPVTDYQWEQRWDRGWNPFGTPYLTYRLVPKTHWETKIESVKIPVARTEMIAEKTTQHVPVTTQQYIKREVVTHEPVAGGIPAGASTAQLASKPPGTGSSDSAPAQSSGTEYGGIQPLSPSTTPKWRASDESSHK